MTWKKTVIFAIIAGIYTGIINQIPMLRGTSFQDIAVTMEWWLLFAVIIAVNTKSPKESALKIFVFFMISQPMVFLTEIPMLGINTALMYYRGWFVRILLTLPGGWLAYYAKKESVVGSLILSCATGLLAVLGYTYFVDCLADFPHHILTVIFCILQSIVYIFLLKKKSIYRMIVAGITIAILVVTMVFSEQSTTDYSIGLPEGNWTCITEFQDGSSGSVDGDIFTYTYDQSKFEDKTIEFKNDEGEIIQYRAYIRDDGTNSVWIEEIQ